MSEVNTSLRRALILAALALVARPAFAEPWKFGVISDTQWIGDAAADDGRNPGTSATDIISQVNAEFIKQKVDLVVAVGDLTDQASAYNMDVRALFAQDLYNAGIGFFPLRGNHDSSDAAEFLNVFPQTRSGLQNATPSYAFGVTSPDFANLAPAPKTGTSWTMGSNFSSPTPSFAPGVPDMTGKSYSFDYKDVRFVLLDQFVVGAPSSQQTIQAQQPWITAALSDRSARSAHAFVFGHKGLITEQHADNLFGSNPAADPAGTDAFISSLTASGVRYYVGGHDHMHDLTQVWTTDGQAAKVTELVCASDSSKFYIPAGNAENTIFGLGISNDQHYDGTAFGHTRQTPLAQELYTVGFYIFTVDGPRVTVDFYSADPHAVNAGGEYMIKTAPTLQFTKRQTFGYSLNGQEFVVAQGQPYTVVQDGFEGTQASIIDGVNGSIAKDGSGRAFSHAIDTGWAPRECGAGSATLSLWGMATEMGSDETDVYAISMSYAPELLKNEAIGNGNFGIVMKASDGTWLRAVDGNIGGVRAYVNGPYRQGYPLGTYGIDPSTKTAWAVVNYTNAQFAVANFEPVKSCK